MLECLLCLESNQDVLKSIKVESAQWEDLCIKKLIDKYLWPLNTITPQSSLCSPCWEELNGFHKFYTRIEEAHINYKWLINTEDDPLEEDIKPRDLLLEKLFEPEIAIGQSLDTIVVIKQEPVETTAYSENDNLADIPEDNPASSIHGDSGDSDASEDSDNDDDLLLIHQRKRITAKTKSKDKEEDGGGTIDSEVKINSVRKSYYQPKTNRLEQDIFLQEHFKITCNKCHQPFETFPLLCKHYSKEHNERGFVTCCKMKFFDRSLLVDHINYHLNPEFFKCEHCAKVFQKRRSLMVHVKLHGDNMKHKCDICEKKFVEKTKLDRHKLRHLSKEEKKFPCNECGKFYADEYALSLHQRVVHQNIYAKVCEICGQTMPNNITFKHHMEKHTTAASSTPVACDECGLILSGKLTLKHHKDLKHPVGGKRDYTCHICMKVSPNMKALKKHIQCTHEMGYNHKCSVCEKAFKRSDNLKAHMAIHTGTPLYRCPWCPKTFNSNGNMHSHRKKIHPIEWEEARRKKYVGNFPPDTYMQFDK